MRVLADTEVADLLKTERPWNVARRIFARQAARISILVDESDAETLEEMRANNTAIHRAEFEAVDEIARALGIMIADLGSRAGLVVPNIDPEGLRKWLGERPASPVPEPDSADLGERAREPPGSGVPARPKSSP